MMRKHRGCDSVGCVCVFMVKDFFGSGAHCHCARLVSRGRLLWCGRGLGAATNSRRVIARILLVWVVWASQTELAARVLPCLAITIPMETKLRQLLPNLCGWLLFEVNPNPTANDFRQAIRCGSLLMQRGQNLWRWQGAVGFPLL